MYIIESVMKCNVSVTYSCQLGCDPRERKPGLNREDLSKNDLSTGGAVSIVSIRQEKIKLCC